jgi:hypothetical protein
MCSWAVFASGELVEFAAQGAADLLPHRTAMRAMTAGTPEMRCSDQRVAGFGIGDGDLHVASPSGGLTGRKARQKQNGPGAVTQPGPLRLCVQSTQCGDAPGGASMAPMTEHEACAKRGFVEFSAWVENMGLREKGGSNGVSLRDCLAPQLAQMINI